MLLLVEDNAATAAIIELMARNENFICDKTDLGIDALEISKLYDYNIIILDLLLPDIDGYGVLPAGACGVGSHAESRSSRTG
jgi:two-component system cell cycle response regulator CtrA